MKGVIHQTQDGSLSAGRWKVGKKGSTLPQKHWEILVVKLGHGVPCVHFVGMLFIAK